jgi:hypothetical protein
MVAIWANVKIYRYVTLKLSVWKDTLVLHLLIPKHSFISNEPYCSKDNIDRSFVENFFTA